MLNKQTNKKKNLRNWDSLRDPWDNIHHTNIHITAVEEGENREKWAENILEDIIAKNSPNLGKETVTQVQEAQCHTGVTQRGIH